MRDILNTVEGYNEIKIFNIDAILEELEDIKKLQHDEEIGIQNYPETNVDIINDTRDTIFKFQYDNLFLVYSIGEDFDKIETQYNYTLDSMKEAWKKSNGYDQIGK